MLRIQNGCAIIWIFVRSIIFPTRKKRVFLVFSTNDRKRSKPRHNNSRRHTRSRCMTSLCASGIPTAMSLRSKKTILQRRLSMYCCIVLTHDPVKQAPPQKPALRGSLPINSLLRPSLPPTTAKTSTGVSWIAVYTRLANDIQVRHYSPKTLKAYTQWVRHLQTFTRSKDPESLSSADVREFLTCLAVDRKVSASTQNQAFNALLFFYRHVLNQEFGKVEGVVRAKRKPYVPVV